GGRGRLIGRRDRLDRLAGADRGAVAAVVGRQHGGVGLLLGGRRGGRGGRRGVGGRGRRRGGRRRLGLRRLVLLRRGLVLLLDGGARRGSGDRLGDDLRLLRDGHRLGGRDDRGRGDRGMRPRAVVRRVVDLDGAGGDQRGRGEAGGRLGRDRADTGRQRAARADPRRPGRRGAGGGGGATRRRGRAEVGEEELLDDEQRADREDRSQRAVCRLELLAEHRAALARAQVPAHRRARALEALGDLAELEAHLLAGQLARLGRL